MLLGRVLERVKGIEPSSGAWEALALPLSYTRKALKCSYQIAGQRQALWSRGVQPALISS